jgi:hypothetical protein
VVRWRRGRQERLHALLRMEEDITPGVLLALFSDAKNAAAALWTGSMTGRQPLLR